MEPPQPEALPPPVAPEHASPSVLDGAARIAQAQAPDLASPAPRRRGSQSNEGPPSAPGKGAARELFSFEDDQVEAPAPAPADDEGPIADDRTADGVFAESEGEEEVVEEAPADGAARRRRRRRQGDGPGVSCDRQDQGLVDGPGAGRVQSPCRGGPRR